MTRFITLSIIDIWGWIILLEPSPLLPTKYPVAPTLDPVVATKKHLQMLPNVNICIESLACLLKIMTAGSNPQKF